MGKTKMKIEWKRRRAKKERGFRGGGRRCDGGREGERKEVRGEERRGEGCGRGIDDPQAGSHHYRVYRRCTC